MAQSPGPGLGGGGARQPGLHLWEPSFNFCLPALLIFLFEVLLDLQGMTESASPGPCVSILQKRGVCLCRARFRYSGHVSRKTIAACDLRKYAVPWGRMA